MSACSSQSHLNKGDTGSVIVNIYEISVAERLQEG